MDTKERFKEFVKKNPILLKHVQSGKMSWQKFYEMYDIYGEDNNIWSSYLENSSSSTGGVLGLFDFVKNLDLDSIQSGVNSMQRVLSLLQDMTDKNNDDISKENYKPRPLYRHFDD